MGAPEEFTPSEHAIGTKEGWSNQRFTITIHNGTDEDVEALMITTDVQSGGQVASQIIDVDFEFGANATVMPGNDLTWTVVYAVADPANIQVTVDNVVDFSAPKAHFTN